MGESFNSPLALMGTTNGGMTWVQQSLPTGIEDMANIACPSVSVCEIPADTSSGSVVLGTTNGGSTWNTQTLPSGTTEAQDGRIVCPTALMCELTAYAQGSGETAFGTTDGGTIWNAQTPPSGDSVATVVCPSASVCEATGNNGTQGVLVGTTNSGSTWTSQALPEGTTTAEQNYVLACPSTAECFSAGLGTWPTGEEILSVSGISSGAPTISSFAPASGAPGTTVVITGTNLQEATAVTIGGVAAKIKVDETTKLKVVVPSGAVTGKIKVKTSNGKATSSSSFTVT